MANARFNSVIAPYMPSEAAEVIRTTIASLYELVKPYTDEVGPEERRALLKMRDKNVAFVERTYMYLRSRPDISPSHLDLDEYEQDLDSVKLFDEFEAQLQQIQSLLSGSRMRRSGSAYAGSLTGYDAFKGAAKRGVQGSSAIVAELAPHFAGRGTRRVKPVDDKPADKGTDDATEN